jgi:hypothetical protein
MVLVLPNHAVGVDVLAILQACPAVGDTGLQDLHDGGMQPAARLICERVGGLGWVDPGLPEGLADVDVAEPRDKLLV